ncbi:MutS-related protein [Chitinophaga cymbidii]|uniref:DNA mismatch repair proteins mutS family domain-containing protein n=1 Tax=Chitinophaga cymbidii TaxID=1096750 RepID=A0A512REC8_9BACT|nr:DNA mismatch repair protein [Chitinophaga cymbidii]GEP94053.1 hypothetical protein CCY01nite_03130 [Chitinophaga cymbidii]
MMILQTDEQTIGDLGIFGKHDSRSIYDIYNRTHTRGGESLLEEMFRNPLSDKAEINRRSNIIENFARLNIPFPYNGSLFDVVEKYLLHGAENHSNGSQSVLGEKEIQNGVAGVIELIRLTSGFVKNSALGEIDAYATEYDSITHLVEDPAFSPVLRLPQKEKPSYAAITAFDALFRNSERHKLEALLRHIYLLDVYMSVAQTAAERKFVFPRALDKGQCLLTLEGVYYPGLQQPVGNNISIDSASNVIFLTGANMAGKSTFLRALSTALYVAHMGFPVAATAMSFSVMDGLYTTINLPDNLGIGASHFYAEVTRVKKMATALSSGKSYFILFDELFRGTNVKDAHEATVAVMKGFATKANSIFIISSHIVEAGESLQQQKNVSFLYMPTRMNGHTPTYTYKLERGITDDRHGMVIIRNEGILDILKKN